ncbi:MAG: diguanylate cyclase [Aquimonas sp.]|nr:diguanylate cyclase [Aquimonas sp.]
MSLTIPNRYASSADLPWFHWRGVALCRLQVALAMFTCLWVVSGLAAEARPLRDYPRVAWTARDGLPHQHINALAQTPDGALWVGTFEGLVRFNGANFTVMRPSNTPVLPDASIIGLSRAQDGSLLVVTSGRGIARWRAGQWLPIPEGINSPKDRVDGAWVDALGQLWVSLRDGGLWRVDANGTKRPIKDQPSSPVFAMQDDASGTMWIAGAFGLRRIEGDQVQSLAPDSGFPAVSVRALHRTPGDGRLVVVTALGVFVERAGRFLPLARELVGINARDLDFGPQGEVIVATTDQGVLRLSPRGELQRFAAEDGLLGTRVNAVLTDRDGDLWIGTGNGLQRLADLPVSMVSTHHGLRNPTIRTLLSRPDGSVLAGGTGGLYRIRDGVAEPVLLEGVASVGTILSLIPSADGEVWVGSDLGVVWKGDAVMRRHAVTDALPGGFEARALAEDERGHLWLGGNLGVARWDGEQLLHFSEATGLRRDYVLRLQSAREGGVWIGFNDGLARYANGAFSAVDVSGENAAREVFSILEDVDGTLWLATDRGLGRHRAGRTQHVDVRHGLPESKFFEVVDDARGNFWLTSNSGMTLVPRENAEAVLDGRGNTLGNVTLNEAFGMAVSQCNGAAGQAGIIHDGEIWAATSAGIAHVSADRAMRFVSLPRGVMIESMRVNGEVVPHDVNPMLPADTQRVEFDVVSPTFRAPDSLYYRHRLTGFDADWVIGDRIGSRVQYTNLAPGEYRFEAQASADFLHWSGDNQAVVFQIAAHWWQRIEFVVLVVGGSLLVLFVGYRLRIRNLQLRERALAMLVAERTAELQSTNSRLRMLNQREAERSADFQQQAMTDALTGLPNRRAFEHRLGLLLQDRVPLVLGLLDVDHFKRINDQYSHGAGDEVLTALGLHLRERLSSTGSQRRGDPFVARWGGEEFAILWPHAALADARDVADRLRESVAQRAWPREGGAFRLTVSLGLAERWEDESADAFVHRADAQLYAAKHAGRNRVEASVDG